MLSNISSKTIQRLTLYHCILRDYIIKEKEYISSNQISELLKIDDSQVRKDITLCNIQGKSKIGYDVAELKKSIEQLLGFKIAKDVFIIGAGNLGLALTNYNDFKDYGLNILALFDVDPKKINTIINSKRVFHLSKLGDLVKRMEIEIAILTVPSPVAQEVADMLVKANIKYIWNFTTTILEVPETIKICNENLMGSFLDFTKN